MTDVANEHATQDANHDASQEATSQDSAVLKEVPSHTTSPSTSEKDDIEKPIDTKEATIDEAESIKPAADPAGTPEYPTAWKATLIIGAIFLAVFLVALDQTIIGTAIPRITDQFKSVGDVGWYGSAYFLTSTALQPTWGRIYTIFNVKWSFLTAIFIFEVGSLICGVAPSSAVLIVGRAIAGTGVAGIFSGGLVIFSYTIPLNRRPLIFGLFGAVWGVASVVGPLLGGAFTDKVSWRWCFYINLPIGGVSAAVVLYILGQRPQAKSGKSLLKKITELDLIGFSLLLPAVVCLLLALQWGGSKYPWKSSRIIGLFIGFGLIAILFIISQIMLGDKATLPKRIMKNRTVASSCAFVFCFGGAFFLLMYYLPIFFQSVKGSSATASGIDLLPILLATVISSIVMGGLVTGVGYYTPFLNLSAAIFSIGAGLLTLYTVDISTGKWIGYQILAGAGVGACFQIPMTAVQTVLAQEDIPIGSAAIFFFQNLGGSLFISVAQSVFENGLVQYIQVHAPDIAPPIILDAGATQIRNVLMQIGKSGELQTVVAAYMSGLRDAYRVTLALTLGAFVASLFLEWKSVKHARDEAKLSAAAVGV